MGSSNNPKWAALVATGFAGIVTGCLTFVSAVDTRSFLAHVKEKPTTHLAKQHFEVWWPYGRDLMVPLLGTTALAQIAAWVLSSNKSWIISGTCLFLVGPYTAIVLGEDIEKLRASTTEEVAETTKRFCNLHHVRTVLAAIGFGLSLVTLADL
jgi:uncharacterized membrane protein